MIYLKVFLVISLSVTSLETYKLSNHLNFNGYLLSDLEALGNTTKEGRLPRNVSSYLGLSDHFPGSGILNYMPDRDW